MKIIKPNTLTLNSCSIAESDSVDGVTWNSSTTYSSANLVRYNHITYISLKDSNTNHRPPDNIGGEDPWWQEVVATMPYRMLDEYVETTTVAPTGQALTFTVPFDRADSFALLNMHGSNVHVVVRDGDGTTTYDSTYDLQDDISSLSLYEYYFTPITPVSSSVNTQIPITFYGTMTVTVSPASSDDTVYIGHVIVGRNRYIGETLYGTELGLVDYSKKNQDDFGYTTFVKRSYSKSASLSLYIPPERVNAVTDLLSELRATPILIEGGNEDSGFEALVIFGWIEDWRTVYTGPNENELRIEVQGLV